MTLRRRLYLAMALFVGVLTGAGFLIVHLAEGTEIRQVDTQLRTGFPAFAAAAPSFRLPADQRVIQECIASAMARRAIASSAGAKNAGPVSAGPKSAGPKSASSNGTLSSCLNTVHVIGNGFYGAVLARGRVQLSVKSAGIGPSAPQLPQAVSVPKPSAFKIMTVGSKYGPQQWRAVLVSSTPSGPKALLAISLTQVDATITKLRLVVVLAGGIVFAVLAAAALWIGRLGLRPIAQVTEVADSITAGDRSRRVAIAHSGTEAGHLARAINVMLDEQEVTESRLRQFVADASHELRTPVSSISGIAELWRLGRFESRKDADDAMRRVGMEGQRMSQLVDELLTLARLDERRPIALVPVELGALARNVVTELAQRYPTRAIELDTDPEATVSGDETGLRQIVSNLVTNAIVHTPLDSGVVVRVSGGTRVTLEVSDHGPGMSLGEVSHAFDRFWRGDASRSKPGSGLGLPIVAGLVAAHRAEVQLASTPQTGTTVRVLFPPRSEA